MMALSLLSIFGLTMIAAMCNLPGWWRLWRRSNELQDELSAARFELRSALFFGNLSMSFACWVRTSSLLEGKNYVVKATSILIFPPLPLLPFPRVNISMPDGIVLVWMSLFLFAEIKYLRSAELALRVQGRHSYALRVFYLTSALWMADVLMWRIYQ